MSSERNLKIDILRVLGIHLVVLAHINNVPKVLLEIREFDVVLLVFLSGFVYSKSSCFQHVLKRAKRLLIPSYLAISAAYCMYDTVFMHNRARRDQKLFIFLARNHSANINISKWWNRLCLDCADILDAGCTVRPDIRHLYPNKIPIGSVYADDCRTNRSGIFGFVF